MIIYIAPDNNHKAHPLQGPHQHYPVKGRPISLLPWPGHYAITQSQYKRDEITVTNVETGTSLANGKTDAEAIANAEARLQEHFTPAGLWEYIVDAMLVLDCIAPRTNQGTPQ